MLGILNSKGTYFTMKLKIDGSKCFLRSNVDLQHKKCCHVAS